MSRIRADQLVNRAGSGGPKFPNGVTDGFSVSGVVTATSFSGNVTGAVTGNVNGNVNGNVTGNADTATTATNAQGLTGTPNIAVGTVGCGNVTSTGDVTGVNATFSGNLTVNGTTTTIDTAVTAVDSLAVDGAGSFGGFVDFIRSASDGYGYLGIGPGGSNEKATFVNRGGEIDLEFYSNYSSSATVSINSDGTATFDGKVDVNNEFHVHRASTTASNALLALHSDIGGTKTRKSTIRADGSAEFAGTISDSLGNLRRVKVDQASTSFTLTAVYSGQLIRMSGGNTTITIPQNVFVAGDMISVWNASTNNITIAQGTGATVYNTADGATGNRTVAARGLVTIVCTFSNEFIISGTQLS